MADKAEVKSANVIIVGGGPVGLISACLLKEYGRRTNVVYNIHLYERRWKEDKSGKIVWKDKTDGNNRRGQVTTIQSNVWSLLPGHVKSALFNANEEDAFIEMWPLVSAHPLIYLSRSFFIYANPNLIWLVEKLSIFWCIAPPF